jgi:hypothetical protein
MPRLLIGLLLFALSGTALTEGPGTRIRSSSQVPRPPQSLAPEKEDACARLREEAARASCLEQARRPVQTGDVPGPGSVSGTSGAGSSSSSATTGAGSPGAAAPR